MPRSTVAARRWSIGSPTLTNLIAIFEDKSLDFSKNRADGDDILDDAYEYLMRHFATESGNLHETMKAILKTAVFIGFTFTRC